MYTLTQMTQPWILRVDGAAQVRVQITPVDEERVRVSLDGDSAVYRPEDMHPVTDEPAVREAWQELRVRADRVLRARMHEAKRRAAQAQHQCAHEHVSEETRPYLRSARGTREERRAAHGGITIEQTCRTCGATRQVNRNGRHEETGAWYDAFDREIC